jgi:Tfp pilus assembly protein PilF
VGSKAGHEKTHALLTEAQQRVGRREVAEARNLINAAFQNEPQLECEKALLLRIQLCMTLRLVPQALHDSGTLLAKHPKDATTLANVAGIEIAAGRFGEASAHLDAAIQLEPKRAGPHVMRATLFESQGDMKKAVESYGAAIQLAPKNHEFLHKRAHFLTKLNRHEESLTDTEAALALVPGHGHYLSMKGKSLVALGRDDEARAAFKAVLTSPQAQPNDKKDARDQMRNLGGQ